ncbi:hypothetical protein DFH29DRAFT_1082984 [Suillus ampliporus]|nr:hypothetical protein DFH29DRAFT_1082984 [Suillus ampliporus]
MHQALLVSDVLLDIFAHVNRDRDTSSTHEMTLSQQSLTALAMTCKTFYDPAMDLLWTNIFEIEPLLGCVLRLHPMIYCHDKKIFRFTGIRPLSKQEACQFLRHATRVHSLCISSDKHFRLLTNLPAKTSVFPRLLSLVWEVRGTKDKYLDLFLSPTLLNCTILPPHPALRSIGTHCGALEGLSIGASSVMLSSDMRAKFDSSLLAEAVCSCKQLTDVDCPPLEWAAWCHLSHLPTLLIVGINGDSDRPLDQPNVKFAPFHNVTHLFFTVNTGAYTITAMQHSEFPSLKEFTMRIYHGLPYAEAEQLFHALSQCKASQTLECINIASYPPQNQEPSGNSSTVITQFLCFTQLRSLILRLDNYFIYLNNDLLLKAMSSWPHMRDMELTDHELHPPTVTFRGLFAALRQCPHFRFLALPIDAVNIDIDPKSESFQHHSLQFLEVGLSDVADAQAVACIIHSMLPCVNSGQVRYPMGPGYETSPWYEVNRLLKSFKSSAVLSPDITGASLAT